MIPRTVYDSDLDVFRSTVRKFVDAEILPYCEKWEKEGQVDRSFWDKAAEMGLLAPTVPEEYGGLGLGYKYSAVVAEESLHAGVSIGVGAGLGLHNDVAVPYIVDNGSDELKRKYLPKFVSGEMITAIAMTEPGTGSDLQSIKTTAILDGDHYILNGSKTFITNGQLCDAVIVVCKTDPDEGADGVSLLLVEANSEGFQKGNNLEKVGMKAQDTSELFFQDVKVPKENLIGEEGLGFIYLMQALPQERLGIAISSICSAEYVLKETIEYVKERRAFGRPIAAFQNTQFKLAEIDSEITVFRVFIDRCIDLHAEGQLDAVTASKAKLLGTELLGKVVDECLQLFGGYGYMMEYPIARAYADARVSRIYGGTSEIMKLIIGRSLLA